MAESGIDLSYDDPIPAKMSLTTGSGGIRVIGMKSPSPNAMSTSMPQPRNCLKQVRLRSSQRLQLMKMQAEAEAKRAPSVPQGIPSIGSASSLPLTTDHSFLRSFQPQSGSLIISSQSSGSMIANLHDYATPSFYNPNSAVLHSLQETPLMNEKPMERSQYFISFAISDGGRSFKMDEEELLSDISGVIDDEISSCSSLNILSLANSCIAELTMEKQEEPFADDEDQTSSSCPLIPLRPAMAIQPYRGGRKKEPPPSFQTEESKMMWLKEREKKDQHNNIEKKRRSKINDYIHELATLLPESYDIDLQNKKGNILEASVDYIRKLQTDEKRLHQMRKQQDELEKQNRRLHLQIQLLQSMNMAPQMQPQPATNPSEVLMPGHMQPELLSPHQHHHHHQLTNDTQLLPTEQSLHQTDQNILLSDGHLFPNEVSNLDFLQSDLFNDELGLDLDPIFAGLHVVTPKSVRDHQIPLVVEEFMELQ